MRFAADPRSPFRARRALEQVAGECPRRVLEDARLLVSELVTNSVLHSDMEPGEWIELNVTTQNGKALRVEVRDAGVGFETQPMENGEERTSHWGLFLVDKLADRWGVVNDGETRVWFELSYSH